MKKHRNKGRVVKLDADLDNELDGYDVESSDDGLDAEDRILLENARGKKRRVEEEEVLPVREASSSESDEEYFDDEVEKDNNDAENDVNDDDIHEEGVSSEMDSDIEDKSDGLPDSKAWGSRRKNYYNTDYVDKDYNGFDDEEAALMEEQEAKVIQQRLLGQLEETDFTMGLLDKVKEKRKEALLKNAKLEIEKKIEVDRSKLLETELREFDEKDTPGFNRIMVDVKNYVDYTLKIVYPIIKMTEGSKLSDCPALRLLKKKHLIILRYSASFLLLLRLKAHRTPNLDRHPIINRLQQFSKVLKDIDAVENRGLRQQITQIIKALREKKTIRLKLKDTIGKQNEVTGKNRKERRKKLLQLLKERNKIDKVMETKERKIKFADEVEGLPLEVYAKLEEQNGVLSEENEENEEVSEAEKRAITYQMLKNKGLTPRRKKEMRNPRVRNKNKFKKALVRRKGQVKIARKELKKYDGEIAGIKKNLSRSIKLK